MGTRNLTAVFYKGEYRIAQYGQWNGYPSGQGKTVLEFLKKMKPRIFKAKLLKVQEATHEEVTALYRQCGSDGSGWVSMDVADRFNKLAPQLSRNAGATILEHVQNSPDGLLIVKNLDFAADSLFCEWAYVVDLDKSVLEVYRGFITSDVAIDPEERFAFLADKAEGKYRPIKLIKTYDLKNLPDENTFVSELEALTRDPEEDK